MIKNIIFSILLNEKSMKKINEMKIKIFIILYGLINIAFPFILKIVDYVINKAQPFMNYVVSFFYGFRENLIVQLILFSLLFLFTYIQSDGKKYPVVILKSIIGMTFINPVFFVLELLIHKISFSFLEVIYEFFFVKLFIRANIDDGISSRKQLFIVIAAFLLEILIYTIFFKLLLRF